MNASPATIHEGNILYKRYCFFCHGVGVVSGSGVPDLRYATAETHHQFESIVLGGARGSRGHAFVQRCSQADQVRTLQAYVLSQPAAGASPPPN
jgi:quinohemoprotein ethanol dehydrogenase